MRSQKVIRMDCLNLFEKKLSLMNFNTLPYSYLLLNKKKNEVDIVIEKDDGKVIGVEVKASASVRRDDFKGLHELSLYAGNRFDKGVLIYSGDQLLSIKFKDRTFYAVPVSLILKNPL